jgi:hypothetical protein
MRTEETTMKVKELIELLGECDREADVYVMSQANYPFECALHGVAERQALAEYNYDDDEPETASRSDRWTASATSLSRNDVFLVEGGQLRYGSRDAWNAAARA